MGSKNWAQGWDFLHSAGESRKGEGHRPFQGGQVCVRAHKLQRRARCRVRGRYCSRRGCAPCAAPQLPCSHVEAGAPVRSSRHQFSKFSSLVVYIAADVLVLRKVIESAEDVGALAVAAHGYSGRVWKLMQPPPSCRAKEWISETSTKPRSFSRFREAGDCGEVASMRSPTRKTR
jgi:hypothetical protein